MSSFLRCLILRAQHPGYKAPLRGAGVPTQKEQQFLHLKWIRHLVGSSGRDPVSRWPKKRVEPHVSRSKLHVCSILPNYLTMIVPIRVPFR